MTESPTFFTPMSSPQVDVPAGQMFDNGSALNQLLDADQEKLLDLIENLRDYSVNEHVELPQVIICGDRSCGKSSVLEGILGQNFPRGEGPCTTFATEFVLRRTEPQITVNIIPADTKPGKKEFKKTYYTSKNLEKLINSAKSHLQEVHKVPERSFFKDTLRIEVSNPNRPPLTFVELPGLISTNEDQPKEDIDVVYDLARKYMRGKKTIILAVLSAENYPVNQKVLSMVKEMDPNGNRTMGIITKPDKLKNGTKWEDRFLRYAKNDHRKYKFKLGWYVVRNCDKGEDGYSLEERNQKEDEFFADSVWERRLGSDQLGINRLRFRLSEVLEQHIRSALSTVVDNINRHSQEEFKGFGGPRSTLSGQETYLVEISHRFHRLVRQAVGKDYIDDRFFDDGSKNSAARKLRSFVERSNRDFRDVMYNRGHKWAVSDSPHYPAWPVTTGTETYGSHSVDAPKSILRAEYIQKAGNKLRERSSRQLPGTFDPRIVTPLFREQCSRWRDIAHAHIECVYKATCCLWYDAIIEASSKNENTANLLFEYLGDILGRKWDALELKLNEILTPYEKLQTTTLNPNFRSSVPYMGGIVKSFQNKLEEFGRKFKKGSTEYQVLAQLHGFISAAEKEPAEFASTASEVLDLVHNYYEVALVQFIENVVDLVVENSLMYGLEEEFTPMTVRKIATENKELLTLLASETPDVTQRRAELTQALKTCLDARGPGILPILPRRIPPHLDPFVIASSSGPTGDSLDKCATPEAAVYSSVSTPARSPHSASPSLSISTPLTVPSPGIDSGGQIESMKGKSRQPFSSVSSASLFGGRSTAPADRSKSLLSSSAGIFEREQSPTPIPKVRVTSQPRRRLSHNRERQSSLSSPTPAPAQTAVENEEEL